MKLSDDDIDTMKESAEVGCAETHWEHKDILNLLDTITADRERIKIAQTFLLTEANHVNGCHQEGGKDWACDCGLDRAIEALAGPEEGKDD